MTAAPTAGAAAVCKVRPMSLSDELLWMTRLSYVHAQCVFRQFVLLSFQSLNEDGGVPLANSVSVSDKLRVDFLKGKARQRASTDQCPFRHGKKKNHFM